ncbi:MAG: hypothetical protein ACK446_03315 [Rhodobacterales bacterium]
MAEVADIKDRQTLEAWLKGRSREDAICIAHRAAMRVAPLFWIRLGEDRARERDLTAVVTLWPLLTSGVARADPTPKVRAAAAAAAAVARADRSGYRGRVDSTAGAAEVAKVRAAAREAKPVEAELVTKALALLTAIASVFPKIGDAALGAAAFAAFAATPEGFAAAPAAAPEVFAAFATHAASLCLAAASEFWPSVRMDCAALDASRDPFALPLWDGPVPEPIADAWAQTRQEWANAGGPVWAFWTQFYENALAGRPQDWALLHDIALIPAEDWQGGPERVHPIIEVMLLERAVKATPNAERITLNPETGKLRVETISSLPPKYLHDAVDSLRDAAAIFDATGSGNNPYALILPDVALLRNGLDRYGTRPNMLVVTCRRVVQRVETKVASGDCPRNDALVEDFLGEVARVISDLLIFDPEVREAASARAAFRLGEVSPQDAKTLDRAASEIALASEGALADEVPKDARMVSDPTRSAAERHEALFQTASRFFRVQTLVKGYKAVRPAIKEAADVSKDIAVVAGTWTGLPAAVALLLKLFL